MSHLRQAEGKKEVGGVEEHWSLRVPAAGSL